MRILLTLLVSCLCCAAQIAVTPMTGQKQQKQVVTVPADGNPFYFCSQNSGDSTTAMSGIYTILDSSGASVSFAMANAVNLTANVIYNDTPTVFQQGSYITVGVSNGYSYLAITVPIALQDTDFTIYAQGDFAGTLSATNLSNLGGGSSFQLDLTKDLSTTGTFGCGVGIFGSEALSVKTVTANYTNSTTDGIIQVDATGGARVITLRQPAASQPIVTVMKKDSSVNAVVVTNAGFTINGKNAFTNSSQFSSATFYTDGTNYFVR